MILSNTTLKIVGKNAIKSLREMGANIDITVLGRVIDRGLAADGRLVRFVATVSDRPGGVAGLTRRVYEAGGSIKDIYHERAWLQSSVSSVQVKCIVEATSHDHAMSIKQTLIDAGYPLVWGSDSDFSSESQRKLLPIESHGTSH